MANTMDTIDTMVNMVIMVTTETTETMDKVQRNRYLISVLGRSNVWTIKRF